MNATNASYNGTRHAEFIAISQILSETIPSPSVASNLDSDSNQGERRWKKKYGPEVLRECDLYVTVEPCIMCASLLRQMGVRKVFFGAGNEKFGGTGGVLNIHSRNGRISPESGEDGVDRVEEDGVLAKSEEGDYEVSGAWMREEAIMLLRRFYVQENERAPEEMRRVKEGKERVLKEGVEPLVLGDGVGC